MSFDQCEEVSLFSCRVMGFSTAQTAIASIIDAYRVSLANNVFEAYLPTSLDRPGGFLKGTLVDPLFTQQPLLDRGEFDLRAFAVSMTLATSSSDLTTLDNVITSLRGATGTGLINSFPTLLDAVRHIQLQSAVAERHGG